MGVVGTPEEKLLEAAESMPDAARGIVGNVVLSEGGAVRIAEVLGEGLLHLRKGGTKLQQGMGEGLRLPTAKGCDLCKSRLTLSLVLSLP